MPYRFSPQEIETVYRVIAERRDMRRSIAMPPGSKPVAILCLGHVEAFYPTPMLKLCAGEDRFAEEREALLVLLPEIEGHLILVSNETGLGIVPLSALSRRFCDEAAGFLHPARAWFWVVPEA